MIKYREWLSYKKEITRKEYLFLLGIGSIPLLGTIVFFGTLLYSIFCKKEQNNQSRWKK